VARWCRLLAESGVPADPGRLGLEVEPDPAAAGATVVHPGAADAGRRWPADRFAAVARRERRDGRRVLVTGGPGEVALAREVAATAGLPPGDVLAGRTDLVALARVVAGADRLVCGDTGVAHLASAVATPSVVLFGPVPPAEWGPPEADGRHVALWAGRPGDPHAARTDPGLLRIWVGDVLAALDRLARFHPTATG
jgi:ADP-heptose:LPS heptosyltransferase